MDINELRIRLSGDRDARRLPKVAAESGVPISTVRKILHGTIKHSRTDTFAKLAAHYERQQ